MTEKQINYIRQQHAKYPAQYMIGETVPKSQEQIRIEGIFPEAFETKFIDVRVEYRDNFSSFRIEDLTYYIHKFLDGKDKGNFTVTELKPAWTDEDMKDYALEYLSRNDTMDEVLEDFKKKHSAS